MADILGGLLTRNLLAISIEGMSLRLLFCQGARARAWSTVPVNPRLLRGGYIVNARGLAAVIKMAVSKKEFSGRRRVLASLPAFHSDRRILEIPDVRGVSPEVVIPQQARRDMGYSEGNSLLFWQPLSSFGGRRRYFVVSVPREPLVTLVETLRLAGLRPSKIETTTFALSRAVNESQAIIIAVEPDSLTSVIVNDSLPVSTRSTFLGEGPRDPATLPTLVTDALDSIINFHNERNPDASLSAAVPVYLLGSGVLLNPDIAAAVETAQGRPVTEFQPPIVCPEGLPKAEQAVNIGLALKEL